MMMMIVPFVFLGEEDDVIVLADHHLQMISYTYILPSILQVNCLDHGIGSPSSVPWFCPPTADYNFNDDQNNLQELDELDRLFINYCINPPPDHLGRFLDDDDMDSTFLSLRCPGTTDDHDDSKKSSRNQEIIEGKRRASAEIKKPSKKRSRNDRDDGPLLPIEQIPTLMKAIQSRNGSRPIFLYGKTLEKSDVERGQNRLFVTRSVRMMDYLGDGGSRGLKIVGVDGGGNVYDNLGVRRWASMNMTVVNSDWGRVVAANSAQKGDVVEIWGFRVDEKPCLAFNFRKQNFAAASSGTSGIDHGTSYIPMV